MKYYKVTFSIAANGDVGIDDVKDVLASVAGNVGFEAFENSADGLIGYVQHDFFSADSLNEILNEFPLPDVEITFETEDAEDRDWNEQWEQEGFSPITASDRLLIHDGRHFDGYDPDCFPVAVEIDAHLAFGTGNHETTRLMLKALLDTNVNGRLILDCGCGTGILGISALKLGASACVSYDIDQWSVDNTLHNATINGVDKLIDTRLGNADILNEIVGLFDIVMANINRNILLADMPAFAKKLADGGRLLLSGFYATDAPFIDRQASVLGLKPAGMLTEGEWCCLVFTA